MSKWSVKMHGEEVPVSHSVGLAEEHVRAALEHQMFLDWVERMGSSTDYRVNSIDIQSIDMFGPNVGFIKFKADVRDREGGFVPGVVFMRGGAVTVLVILECEGEEHVILTVQPRVPIGSFCFPELPAGMLGGSGNFEGTAARELKEETGIAIDASELVDLTAAVYKDHYRGVYPSAGGCDEFIRIFLYKKEVTKEELLSFQGKLTGELHEGEKITLNLVPLAELPMHTPDMKALSAVCLLNTLKCWELSTQ